MTTIAEWLLSAGHPADSLVIAVCEEYGYRTWLWVYPGTREQLRADWDRFHAPINFFDPSVGNYEGTMIEVEVEYDEDDVRTAPLEPVWDQAREAGLYAHVHEPEDTFLLIDGNDGSPTENTPS